MRCVCFKFVCDSVEWKLHRLQLATESNVRNSILQRQDKNDLRQGNLNVCDVQYDNVVLYAICVFVTFFFIIKFYHFYRWLRRRGTSFRGTITSKEKKKQNFRTYVNVSGRWLQFLAVGIGVSVDVRLTGDAK